MLVAPIEGTIDPVAAEFVERLINRAERENYDALVLQIDTPGGLSTSMDEIVKDIVNAEDLVVFVHVAPGGARAGSAGAFITMASDVAAMAPGTTIGSATPINSNGGSLEGDLRKKVINDATSKMRSLAEERGRNAKAAEGFVTKAQNVTAKEALADDVIEYIADDVADLLSQSDGTTVEPKGLSVEFRDAKIQNEELPTSLRLLKLLIDPNLLFLMFSGGLLGLAFELTHPGSIFPGVVGGILLLIALFGLQVLPLTTAGIVFLLLAAALFAAEALVVSHGILGGGGAVCLFVGGLLLFEDDSGYGIDVWLLALVSLAMAALIAFVVHKALAARREQVSTGAEFLAGKIAAVRQPITPSGTVYVEGELWRARSADGTPIDADRVRVVRTEGLELLVEPTELPSAHTNQEEGTTP